MLQLSFQVQRVQVEETAPELGLRSGSGSPCSLEPAPSHLQTVHSRSLVQIYFSHSLNTKQGSLLIFLVPTQGLQKDQYRFLRGCQDLLFQVQLLRGFPFRSLRQNQPKETNLKIVLTEINLLQRNSEHMFQTLILNTHIVAT